MSYSIAVVGATGNVGREILQILDERKFPADKVHALASGHSLGTEVSFGEDKVLRVEDIENFDFSKVDFVFASAGSKVSQLYGPKAAQQGAIYIDNSSAFRRNPEIPLIVPEVNSHSLEDFRNHNIIASPNCIAIPLAMVLKPLHDIASIKRVVASTYQSTSGAGRKAMDELYRQTRNIYMNDSVKKEVFSKQIAFNVIPQVGDFLDNGSTEEEEKVSYEIQKIVDSNIDLAITCVRVPVFIGHAISATIEFNDPLSLEQAELSLQKAGMVITDLQKEDQYVTPAECVGDDEVYLSRIRQDPTVPYGLSLWISSDNLRKGAALNTVQIAESLYHS